jgi:16S rRNA (guanine527-N7)-methyltransferase
VSAPDSFGELLAPYAAGPALDRLVRYAELLEIWSKRHSLVRFRDRGELVERHLAEALVARELLEGSGRLLDVGSGAGLPGVPLLAVSSAWRGLLLEPRSKRWAFLRTVIRELELDARALACRYQDLADDERAYDLITTRALGDYDPLLSWARNRLGEHGQVLLWATTETAESLAAAPEWRVLSSPLPRLDRGRLVRLQPCFT